MKKSITVLITLALIAAMLFSCSSAQQESSASGSIDLGTSVAESAFSISSAASEILQAIILFAVLAADFFIRYKLVFRGSEKEVKE